jgi:hypothetical protein
LGQIYGFFRKNISHGGCPAQNLKKKTRTLNDTRPGLQYTQLSHYEELAEKLPPPGALKALMHPRNPFSLRLA